MAAETDRQVDPELERRILDNLFSFGPKGQYVAPSGEQVDGNEQRRFIPQLEIGNPAVDATCQVEPRSVTVNDHEYEV